MVNLYTDGGARGNPGHAAIGVVIQDENGKVLETISEYIGKATNNIAEYIALIRGLKKTSEMKHKEVACFLDSELVVKQLNNEYKLKNAELAKLFIQIHNLRGQFKKVIFTHIDREKNKMADRLVNDALNKQLRSSP